MVRVNLSGTELTKLVDILIKLMRTRGVEWLDLKRQKNISESSIQNEYMCCICVALYLHYPFSNKFVWLSEFINKTPDQIRTYLNIYYNENAHEYDKFYDTFFAINDNIENFFRKIILDKNTIFDWQYKSERQKRQDVRIEFIQRHIKLFDLAYTNKDNHASFTGTLIVDLARKEIGYSTATASMDIYRFLIRRYIKSLNIENDPEENDTELNEIEDKTPDSIDAVLLEIGNKNRERNSEIYKFNS